MTAVVVLGLSAGAARPAGSDQITITMLISTDAQASFEVLIPNFERVYPNITVNATYGPTGGAGTQLEATEIAAGNAPDVLKAQPGCGLVISVCVLAKDGDLSPILKARWARWSLRSVISLSKYGEGLFAFLTSVGPGGVFTNDDLFRKLGLKVPGTFPQLLALCHAAKTDGTVALELGTDTSEFDWLIADLAVANVYAADKHWAAERKAGVVSFDRSTGWQETLQEVIEMNNAGCFQSGAVGTSQTSAIAQFSQGQGLMIAQTSGQKSLLDGDSPQFSYSFHPFPAAASPGQSPVMVLMGIGLGVNAHSGAANQSAAQTFIDFVARPAQNALYAKIKGSLTQYQFLHNQIQPFMSSFAPLFAAHEYMIDPIQGWWNPDVQAALDQREVGLLTGQESVDDILKAMDSAWNEGPS
jgi:raffinose/stachyose/melibiose transport system substrate-binding protein